VDYDKVIVWIYALDIEAELTIWTNQIPNLNKKDKQRRTKTTKSQNKKRNRCENHLFQ